MTARSDGVDAAPHADDVDQVVADSTSVAPAPERPAGPATGRCECSGVRYTVTGALRDVVDCHCPRCRRITGHYLAATGADTDHVTLLSQETLTWYAPVPGVEYGFCRTCGSTLFWRTAERPDWLSIAAGTLDPPTGLRTTRALWVAEASDYFERPPGVRELQYED